MATIMDGEATPAQIGALLAALAARGETEDEIVGFARTMRARAVPLTAPGCHRHVRHRRRRRGHVQHLHRRVARRGRLRRSPWRSTATARPRAGAGAPTCSRRSDCGSTRPLATVQRSLDETGWAFLFAPAFHASTRHAVAPRKELGVAHGLQPPRPAHEPRPAGSAGRRASRGRTSYPSSPRCLRRPRACRGPGSSTARASTRCRSRARPQSPPLEERTTSAAFDVSPEDAGLPVRTSLAARRHRGRQRGDRPRRPRRSARGPRRDVVLLNAAAALVVAGRARDLREGARAGGRSHRRWPGAAAPGAASRR